MSLASRSVVRDAWCVIWLLLGTTVAVLVTGCGTSRVDVVRDASPHISAGSTPRLMQPEAYRVPSGSMEPTLPVGTRLVVKQGPPAVGVIMVFHPPTGAEQDECGPASHALKPGGAACDAPVPATADVEFIARVVAGPGDEVYIRDGHVYRKANGARAFVRERDAYTRACGSKSHECNFPLAIKVPTGYWFMMGDNRGESDDSRFYGPVPTAWMVGVASEVIRRRFAETRHQPKHQSFRDRAIASVVACLHHAGVETPRSDSAVLSSTSGIRTRSPRVRAAIGKCRSDL